MHIEIVRADYENSRHQLDIPFLLNVYACDPMGGGEPLKDDVMCNLVPALSAIPHAFSILAYVNDKPAGLVNCFEGFSTFACKPLINIHDICVLGEYRGMGLSQRLLEKVEAVAKEKGCCKITLGVCAAEVTFWQNRPKFFSIRKTDGNHLPPVFSRPGIAPPPKPERVAA